MIQRDLMQMQIIRITINVQEKMVYKQIHSMSWISKQHTLAFERPRSCRNLLELGAASEGFTARARPFQLCNSFGEAGA